MDNNKNNTDSMRTIILALNGITRIVFFIGTIISFIAGFTTSAIIQCSAFLFTVGLDLIALAPWRIKTVDIGHVLAYAVLAGTTLMVVTVGSIPPLVYGATMAVLCSLGVRYCFEDLVPAR